MHGGLTATPAALRSPIAQEWFGKTSGIGANQGAWLGKAQHSANPEQSVNSACRARKSRAWMGIIAPSQ
eukprot:2858825-Amphidinium_carterae.1